MGRPVRDRPFRAVRRTGQRATQHDDGHVGGRVRAAAPGVRMIRVLIADDHSVLRHGLVALLGSLDDMQVVAA